MEPTVVCDADFGSYAASTSTADPGSFLAVYGCLGTGPLRLAARLAPRPKGARPAGVSHAGTGAAGSR